VIGVVDLAQHAIGVVGHAGKKTPCCLTRTGAKFGKHARNTLGLQAGEPQRQPLACLARIQKPLAAIVRARALQHIALINELFEHAAEGLFGDFQDVEQVGDFDAGIAIDEVQHPMVRAAEAKLYQHFIRIADEIAIGEEQKLDQIPIRLLTAVRFFDRIGSTDGGLGRGDANISHLGQ
jgi:hypothetical protein